MHAALGWRERGGAQHGMAQWQGYTRLRQAALRCVLPACCHHQCRGCCSKHTNASMRRRCVWCSRARRLESAWMNVCCH